MKCTNCGYDNKDGALFCEACGERLVKQEPYNDRNTSYEQRYDDDYMYDEEYERRRRARQRNERIRDQQKAENKKIIIIGIVVAAIIAAVGIGAFFGIQYFTNKPETSQTSEITKKPGELFSKLTQEPDKQEEPKTTMTPVPTVTPTVTPANTPTPIPTPTMTPEPEVVTATVDKSSAISKAGYNKVSIISAEASSRLYQEEYDNSPMMTYDGDETSSWQDGIEGEGVGEFLHYNLSRDYDVRYITLKLGNWRSQDHYNQNSRPKDITVWLDDQSFELTVPDGKTEYCIAFSSDVECSEVYIRIESVYSGTQYQDTCISEVGIYGK